MQRRPGNVVIADQHEIYCDGLESLLVRKAGLNCETTRDIDAAIRLIEQDDNTLLVLDSTVEGMRGVETVRMLRLRFAHLRILITMRRAKRAELFELIGAGAHGVVSKDADAEESLVAVRTVLEGHIFVPPSVTEQAPDGGIDAGSGSQLQELTDRQLEIVTLMSQGHSNKVIARTLGISPSTVKVHLHAAFRTLGVHSRVGAASAAFASERSAFFVADRQPRAEPEELGGQ